MPMLQPGNQNILAHPPKQSTPRSYIHTSRSNDPTNSDKNAPQYAPEARHGFVEDPRSGSVSLDLLYSSGGV
jgi:hypothetical protein